MKSGRAKDKIFSDTALRYIMEKIAEIMTNGLSIKYKQFDSRATEWGNEQEPNAIKFYEQFTGHKVDPVGFCKLTDFFGASPDGLIGEDGVIEIKCPYNSINHVKHLLCQAPDDLPDEYYWQIQAELLATGRAWCDFVSYDPRCTERTCIKILRVERDEAVMNQLRERIDLATGEMLRIIDQING